MTAKREFDFQDGYGPVPAKRHRNPDGKLGGWVANTARVYGDARVFGNARVSGTARVTWGYTGYNWTAWRNKDKSVTLRFGCETHEIKAWSRIHNRLAKEHGEKHGAKWTKAVCALVRAYFK